MSAKVDSSILDNEQILSIWGYILKDINPNTIRKEGEITAREFAELSGITIDLARKKLKALENKGCITKRWYKDGNSRVYIYLPTGK